jgi:hypothetical protein
LDRAYGKPSHFHTTDAGQFRGACDMTDDELAAIIAGAQPARPVSVEPEAEYLPPDVKKMN